MTYDDWKTRSDRDEGPQPEPPFDECDTCGHRVTCDCSCCNEYWGEYGPSLLKGEGR